MTTDNQRIEKNVELRTTEAPSERQELSTKILNVDDQQLDHQIGVRRRSKLKKQTQRNVESSKKLIAVHTRVTRHALPAVRKRNMRKRPDSENTARRMPQSKMHLEFNMGRDNRVARKQLQPKSQRTTDKFIREPIEIKDMEKTEVLKLD
jgi:Mg2+ and Co2+ transporter CorA